MVESLKCISPVDGSVYVERPLLGPDAVAAAAAKARSAQPVWAATPLEERQRILSAGIDAFVAEGDAIAREISWQMGRPASQTPGEVAGYEERARHMIAIAPEALADVAVAPIDGFDRFIRHDPLGVVFVIAPWNYPYLTAINSVLPALAAGNTVLLKHSAQTPLCAERMVESFRAGGVPEGVIQYLHLDHRNTLDLVGSGDVDFVSFTGSVPAGHAVQEAAARQFIGIGLELGGKDPAYVRADADLGWAAAQVMDGAFFNAGQSCCGIERVYVHESAFDEFVEAAVAEVSALRLGNPMDDGTTLGPLARAEASGFVRGQVADAIAAGANALIDSSAFPADDPGTAYLAPQLLTGVDHTMDVMTEETFGPVVGVMSVASDEAAVELMNDSPFGLTASIWTEDADAALALGEQVRTGTWFMNRCDYLDPALAWTGIGDSGRGCSLSVLGYGQLTRPKSYHLRVKR